MDEEIKNVQNEDGINEETAEETTANAEVEEEPIGNIKISVDVVSTIAGGKKYRGCVRHGEHHYGRLCGVFGNEKSVKGR